MLASALRMVMIALAWFSASVGFAGAVLSGVGKLPPVGPPYGSESYLNGVFVASDETTREGHAE